jgi:hypothetical protein
MLRLFAGRPLLILNGELDPNCPIEGAEIAFAAARQAYQEAIQVIDAVAQGLDDADLRVTFLTSPPVQQIRQRTQPDVPLSEPMAPAAEASQAPRLSRADRQTWVMEHLQVNGSISPRAYAAALGVSVDTALLDLRELVQRGCVQAEGTTKDRCYRLSPTSA